MPLKPKLKSEDVFPLAIRAEIDAADIYRGLDARVKNEALKRKLDFLAREEDRHKAILERLFKDHFPGRKLIVPSVGRKAAHPAVLYDDLSVLELFQLAMSKEKEAEEYYKAARVEAEDDRTRRILDYLARTERSHYYMLRSEIDLLFRFPDYYDVEEANEGQDLFHIGA